MEYQHYVIDAFQEQAMSWRARVRRRDGARIVVQEAALPAWTTMICPTPEAAEVEAMEAIDIGVFKLRGLDKHHA